MERDEYFLIIKILENFKNTENLYFLIYLKQRKFHESYAFNCFPYEHNAYDLRYAFASSLFWQSPFCRNSATKNANFFIKKSS